MPSQPNLSDGKSGSDGLLHASRSERLQKYLSRAGVASRRRAEEMILAGRVSVNGATVRELGVRVTPEEDDVLVDGKPVTAPETCTYIMLNKPAGVVTTLDDPQGRPAVVSFIPEDSPRLFPVGRLDAATTGLLLLTNDGSLAHALMHPSFHVDKVYRAEVDGVPDEADVVALREGVQLDDGVTAPAHARVLSRGIASSVVELTIHEGKKRQVRRMLAAVGHPVRALCRVAYGPLSLGGLPEGKTRPLTEAEVCLLKRSAMRDV